MSMRTGGTYLYRIIAPAYRSVSAGSRTIIVRPMSPLVVFPPIGTSVRALLISLHDGLERRLVGPPENREHQIFIQSARVLVDPVSLDCPRHPLIDVDVVASAVCFPS